MSAPATPDRPTSPPRPRTPQQEVDALRRKLAEQKTLNEAAARDFSQVKDNQLRASRASRARTKYAMQSALAGLVVMTVVCASRGRSIERLRGKHAKATAALETCRGDVAALKRGGARVVVSDANASMEDAPQTLETCGAALVRERAARQVNEARAEALSRALDAFRTDDREYFDDADALRSTLDEVKLVLIAKERALNEMTRRVRVLQMLVTLVVAACGALASQPAVRESVRNLIDSADRRQIEANARAEVVARSSPVKSSAKPPVDGGAVTASSPPRIVVAKAPATVEMDGLRSPTKLSRTTSKTRID